MRRATYLGVAKNAVVRVVMLYFVPGTIYVSLDTDATYSSTWYQEPPVKLLQVEK